MGSGTETRHTTETISGTPCGPLKSLLEPFSVPLLGNVWSPSAYHHSSTKMPVHEQLDFQKQIEKHAKANKYSMIH